MWLMDAQISILNSISGHTDLRSKKAMPVKALPSTT